jgi:hypothetical protein
MLDYFPHATVVESTPSDTSDIFPENPEIFFETRYEQLNFADVDIDTFGGMKLGDKAGNYWGVRRLDTPDVCLGTHLDTYVHTPNGAFFHGIQDQLLEFFTPDQMKDVIVKDSVSYGGKSTIREYQFPSITKDIITDTNHTSSVMFRVIAWNCFDGSSKARIIYGSIDSFCLNGLISGDYEANVGKRTSGFKLTRFLDRMSEGMQRFETDTQLIQGYAESKVNLTSVEQFFEELGVTKQQTERLKDQFIRESYERGMNLWSVVSTLTYDASHRTINTTKHDHEGVTRIKDQREVATWLKSNAWSHLCEEAA